MTAPLLPPPAETILMYAAWGWAFEQGYLSRSARPKLPERTLWVPLFYDLTKIETGMSHLKELAVAGCIAWSISPSTRACLDDAFRDPRITDLLTESLLDLAATAREPFALTPTGRRSATPQKTNAPTPLKPHAIVAVPIAAAPTAPARPQAFPGNKRLTLSL